jgi:hypothetical protein
MRQSVAVLVTAAALLLHCAAPSPEAEVDPGQLPVYLQPLAGSTGVRAAQDGAEAGVEYRLHACYPAQDQLARIAARLPATWKPRSEDFMNPGVPTSNVRGWTDYVDLSQKPETRVHHWAGEWQDDQGNILSYSLMYRSPAVSTADTQSPPANCDLKVNAVLQSQETVKALVAARN